MPEISRYFGIIMSLLHNPLPTIRCHSERSEESRYTPNETLRCAQGDSRTGLRNRLYTDVF